MPDEEIKKKAAEKRKENGAFGKEGVDKANPELEGVQEESRADVIDKFKEPGGLEVEVMPESDELQERRKKTKSSLKEMTDEVRDEGADGELFGDEDGGIMDLLRESNLSLRHVKFCCGGVLGIVLIAVGVWGLIQVSPSVLDFVTNLFSGDGNVEEVVAGDADGADDADGAGDADGAENDAAVSIGDYESLDSSIYSGIFIGEEMTEEDLSTAAGENIGEELRSGDALTPYIEEFANMYRSMQVDVQELLNSSRDRQETLDEYDQELNYLLYIGKQNLEQLRTDAEKLTEKYTAAEAERDDYEARFFTRLKELDTYASIAMLNDFVVAAEEVINLRAQYKARVKLVGYYEALIVAMEARIRDIELNEEALVKGVKVVDITGSDIDLIIDETEL